LAASKGEPSGETGCQTLGWKLAPQAGFGTANAERSEALRFPEDRLRLPTRAKDWLAALDDFRNWLIRETA
jgi:hypothetical protein